MGRRCAGRIHANLTFNFKGATVKWSLRQSNRNASDSVSEAFFVSG